MLYKLMGKEPKFIKVPIEIMTGVIKVLDTLAGFFPGLVDAAEFGKIGKYYAAESMLVINPETGLYDADMTPSYGKDTLEEFFKKSLEGGMEGQELGDAAVWGQK
jgi:divinyl chlorophyllide a 8-vinyl-reductase